MPGAQLQNAFRAERNFREDLKEKKEDWKSKLSGAFSSEQIFFSLFVLSVFYAGYTIINVDGHYDVDTKDEGHIIDSCNCTSSHSDFYRAWFGICCGLWLILHTYTYVAVRFRSSEDFLKLMKVIFQDLLKYSKGLLTHCYKFCCKCKRSDTVTVNINPRSGPKSQPDESNQNDIIQRYIKVLWFQYYKLYVIGYAKGKDEKIILNQPDTNDKSDDKEEEVTWFCCSAYIEKKVKKTDEEQGDDCKSDDKEKCTCICFLSSAYIEKKPNKKQGDDRKSDDKEKVSCSRSAYTEEKVKKPDDCKSEKVTCFCCSKSAYTEEKVKKPDDCKSEKVTCFCCSTSAYTEKKFKKPDEEQGDDSCTCGCDTELGLCFNILKNLSHIILLSVKYLAQLLTMPLLFLQIFDTYSLLCFSPKLLCSDSSEYKLHLAQAAITLLFYCCLALSQLASTMLTWNPWPKKDDESDEEPRYG